MRNQRDILASRTSQLTRLPLNAITTSLLIVSLGEISLLAQQPPATGWSQSPYYTQYTQAPPSAYPQSPYPQPGYGQPQNYGQQPYGSQAYPQPSYPAPSSAAPQPGYGQAQPLSAAQLEQLVAPIALYPDTLVAQVLAASTYPTQVVQADRWLQAQGYASADQVASGANVQNWDPSIKALTAFPQVLQQMDQNLQWTTDLGNAYFNQPQDVLEAVQILRQRAEAAGTLQNTPQEQVSYNQGSIELAPANPQVVYVPAYNPWTVYGQPLNPYPGFSLLGAIGSFLGSVPLRYGPGILMSAFSSTPWGWLGWALNWLNLSVLFNHSNYYTHSTTVADWGLPHGGWRAAAERGGVVGALYRPSGNYGDNFGRPANEYPNRYGGQNFASAPNRYPASGAYNSARGYPTPQNNYARPTQLAYNHFQSPYGGSPYAASQYGRSAGQGNYGYPGRTSTAYGGNLAQAYRAPAAGFQQGGFNNRSSGAFAGNSFVGSSPKPPGSGGFHLFGGGHGSENGFGGGHAPKGFGGGKISSPKHFGGGGGHFGAHHRL
jgi:hypothetical protein